MPLADSPGGLGSASTKPPLDLCLSPAPVTASAGRGPVRAADLPALAAWHAGWALAAALLALVSGWIGATITGPVAAGLMLAVAPGLLGIGLFWRDSPGLRALALVAWCAAVVVALGLSGGVTGPLSGFVFMPIAAGALLGGSRLAVAGALGSALAAATGLAAGILAAPPPDAPGLAAFTVVMAAGAAAIALRLVGSGRERRLAVAESAVGRVEALLSGQPSLTLLLERSGRVIAAYGVPPPAFAVDPLFDHGLVAAVHAPDRAALLSAFDKALAGHEAQLIFSPRTALDRRVALVVRRFDHPADAGEQPRLIAQAFDGTVQYARELGLEIARAEAEARNTGKSRFLANMSHELRTPLNAVLGFSDIMRQRLFGPLPDRYAEYATSIHTAGQHLLDLINDVLDVSKIEAERYELSRDSFDAREVVSAAITLVRLQADDKGVALAGVLPADVVCVDADRRALKQIALNLLSNAIKFTPNGGSVTASLTVIGPYLELVVSDTGVGVSPDDLKRLGRPYEQAGDVDQKVQGTGLGLSLVRALAELHGGRMTIESTLGEGTAVTVRLPVVVPAQTSLFATPAATG